MNYLLITDIPAPWREKVYEIVHRHLGDSFHVVYCKHNEKRRLWTFEHGKHPRTFLSSVTLTIQGRERFCNFGIVPFLLKYRPRVVVCFSLNPTILLALLVARLLRCKIVVFADTWMGRDRALSWIQKWTRRVVYSSLVADAYLGASRKTLEMYQFYNHALKPDSLFQSALCADNQYFLQTPQSPISERPYDLMFAGRLVPEKNPMFFAEVAGLLKRRFGQCRVLIIGEGEEECKRAMFAKLEQEGVEFNFAGFIEHRKLPHYYGQSKILLLPTSIDCWGVVINEAMVSGTTVITTPWTAAAGELVRDGENGFVLPLDVSAWVERATQLLQNGQKLNQFSHRAREAVLPYCFEQAAQGILDAIRYVEGGSVHFTTSRQSLQTTPSQSDCPKEVDLKLMRE